MIPICRFLEKEKVNYLKGLHEIVKKLNLPHYLEYIKLMKIQKEGNRSVTREISYYNLDMIISIGFRVNSKRAIKFRTWANKIIKDYNEFKM